MDIKLLFKNSDLIWLSAIVIAFGGYEVHAMIKTINNIQNGGSAEFSSVTTEKKSNEKKAIEVQVDSASSIDESMVSLELGCVKDLGTRKQIGVAVGLIQLRGKICDIETRRKVLSYSIVNQTTGLAAVTFMTKSSQLMTDYIHLNSGINSIEFRLVGKEKFILNKTIDVNYENLNQ